jgi:hypothetical protein
VSTATVTRRPARAGTANGGVAARRAVIRWAWRLFRREWRQQLLVLGLLTVAVAATIWSAGVATNTPPPATATFGTATAAISLPGNDPHLAAEIAQIARNYGPVDVIENHALSTGSTQSVELRAQDPAGRFGRPLLALVSGQYPAGPGQVALTSQVASLYDVKAGGTWPADGRSWLVTGIVENPTDLNDEFALVAPGQVTAPTQVTILLSAPQGAGQNQNQIAAGPPPPVFAGLPADATVSLASQSGSAGITVITTHAIQQYKLQTSLDGWFIQAPQPLTFAQISSARQIAANAGVTVETKSGELGLNQISDGATVLGLVIALGVLVMSVGLVRSETSGELRTLAATGASSRIRRSITSATAGAISLLGAVLGAAGATAAGVAWARSSLTITFADFPVPDVLAVLVGLPLVAVVGGWLLASRQPQVMARQPLE